jgi:hypothetical protein
MITHDDSITKSNVHHVFVHSLCGLDELTSTGCIFQKHILQPRNSPADDSPASKRKEIEALSMVITSHA